MEFTDVIHNRESVRNYDPEKSISRETLAKILEAGRIAPSVANRQPWRFVVVTSKEMLEKLKPCYEREWFHQATCVLAVVGNGRDTWVRAADEYNSLETDCAIAFLQIILAAQNEGVATCWISNFRPNLLRQVLKLKDDEFIFGITPLGYPRADYQKKR